MQISITGRHVSISPAVKAYAQRKAEKLLRHYDRIQSIEIIIDKQSDNYTVDAIVGAAGTSPFVGRESAPETLAAIDLLMDKMTRQLTRHKERSRNRKHLGRNVERFEEP